MPEERYDDLTPTDLPAASRGGARAPSPGLAAVLSVLIPGLGHVYAGRLLAGLVWFLATGFGYWAILVPGFAIHVASVYFAYQAAKDFRSY